jgi:PAS domain S-box-containing protein
LAEVLFQESPHALFLLDPGTDRLLQANPRALDACGFRLVELQSCPASRLLRSESPGEREPWNHLAAEATEPSTRSGFRSGYRLRTRAEGVWLPVEVRVSRVEREDGLRVLLTVRDTSSPGQARVRHLEDELCRSREWFQAVLQASRDGIVVEDDDRVTYANQAAARLYGYGDPAEMIGLPVSLFQMPEDAVRMREYGVRRVRGESAPAVYLFKGRHRDGSLLTLEASVSTCEVGGKCYVITVLRDIAERTALEEQLRRAQKMEAIGRLAGGVAHDFNNLLTIVNGYAELLLLDGAVANPESVRMLAEVKRAGERAAALTRQLLAFGRKTVLQPRILDLNTVIEEASEMLLALLGERVEVAYRLDPFLGRLEADALQLEQVLINLVINARDAMPFGGQVRITTRNVAVGAAQAGQYPGARPGPHVLLEVTDTGCGMTEEVKAHLFEPFFTTKEAGKGTGLGLASVYGIVQQSGGHIEVLSQPGQGSTFRVYLPRVEAAEEGRDGAWRVARDQGPSGTVPYQGTGTILLVEDEDEVRCLVRGVLVQAGYTVLEARDGLEAISLVETWGTIDLLVTDVVMPHLTGPQLANWLRVGRHRLRVLYLSGYPDDELGKHGVLDAGVALLEKPFSPTDLARKVAEVLGQRPALTR